MLGEPMMRVVCISMNIITHPVGEPKEKPKSKNLG